MKISVFLLAILFVSQSLAGGRLDLEVREVREENPSYEEFCQNWPGECDLSGKKVITYSPELKRTLEKINKTVNRDVELAYDKALYNREEFWNYPVNGKGDCEDNALEKRRQLVEMGYPRGALRMTTAFHDQQFYAHALLLVETTNGTYVLDQDNQRVVLWNKAPYIYEARERTDGRWERFYQNW